MPYWRSEAGGYYHFDQHTHPKLEHLFMRMTEVSKEDYDQNKGKAPVGDDVEIFVPSRSRFDRSLTLEALKEGKLNERVVLVVPYEQGKDYLPLAKRMKVKQVLRCKDNGIAKTRKFIGERAQDKFVMFDDDLRFYCRILNKPEDTRLHKLNQYGMFNLMVLISRALDHYKHVAVSAREGNNRLKIPFVANSRPLRVLAYRKKPFMECEHGRVAIMEDFDVTLQLMRMGYSNCVITEYAQDQPGTQAAGGCSDYRTHKLHEANVRRLAELHDPFVKIRQKENKTGGEFGTRIEATIYWAKAAAEPFKELLG